MVLTPGLAATVELVVGDGDTATALGSGDVPVLGTPRFLALAEEATVAAVAAELGDGSTTVGHQVTLEHRRATPVGTKVRAEATLVELDGRNLTFRVSVTDDAGPVGDATITRVVVDRARFLERLG